MKLFLASITKKPSLKRLLQLCLLSAVLVNIALANVAKEEPTADQENLHAEEAEHEEKSANFSDEQLQAAAIELAQVGPATIRETLPLYGTVEANAERVQHISARFPGTVRSVSKKVGDQVREGEVVATIESNESLKTYPITSALSGVIAERNINVGEHISDKTAFVVADLSSVWIEVAVFPRDAAKIRTGQMVRIGNPANDVTAEGEIIAVAILGNSTNQSLNARVQLQNADRQWTPGLFVNAEVILAKKSATLTIRNEALQSHEGKQVVFVKGAEGFEPRLVKLGRTDGEVSEVLSGVSAGETYVSKNSFIIKAELGKDGAEHGH